MTLSLSLELLLTNLPVEDRVKTAARLGFKWVEIWLVDNLFKGTPDQLAKSGAGEWRQFHGYRH